MDEYSSLEVLLPHVKVQVFDENEETTCIDKATLLTADKLKQWLLVPLISLVTLFVWPIFLYWKIPMQRDWLYKPAVSVETATHIYIEGRDGNLQIVNVHDYSERSNRLIQRAKQGDMHAEGLSIFFTYRFIMFEFKNA